MHEEPIRIPITDVFDLHTVPARDVKPIVEEYLEEARRLGFKALRIIHGRGIGVQRPSLILFTACGSVEPTAPNGEAARGGTP